MSKPPKSIHYVSNVKLYEEYKLYIAAYNTAKENNTPPPAVNPYIVEAFMKIANKLANRPNFIGYPFKEEMIGDAILTCVNSVHKFDPNRSNNPFAYITQICMNAFIRRINIERKQMSVKSRYLFETVSEDMFDTQSHDESEVAFRNSYTDFLKDNSVYRDTIREKKESLKKQKEKDDVAKGANLLDFMSNGDINDEEETDNDSEY